VGLGAREMSAEDKSLGVVILQNMERLEYATIMVMYLNF
jgi:hypothetical protein